MSEVKSTSFLKFENMNDYVAGLTGLAEVLDEWVSKSDPGYERQYNLIKHDDEYRLEIELIVTPH